MTKAGVGYAGMVKPPVPDTVDQSTQWHQQFGLVMASCDRADLKVWGRGITVYGAEGVQHLDVPPDPGGGSRAGVFNELADAVQHGKPPVHSGRWALANLEVCLGLMTSAQQRQEVRLHHQIPVPDLGPSGGLTAPSARRS
jgi:phthalate 4,5-cis-dihydrodiol dehydrogenase